jgi:hypothetical protein
VPSADPERDVLALLAAACDDLGLTAHAAGGAS